MNNDVGTVEPSPMTFGLTDQQEGHRQRSLPAAAHGTSPSNGNIHEQKITPLGMSGSGFLIQSYTYDPLNRLDIAAEHTATPGSILCPDAGAEWCRQFGYDRYGNRAVAAESSLTAHATRPQAFSATTNRVIDDGWAYDEAGNVDELDLGGGVTHSMAYDADNHQTAFCTAFGDLGGNCAPVAAAGRTLYHYDAGGNRVKKSGPSGTSIYVYDAFGKLAAEYKDSGTPTPGTFYRTVDHLGSTRLVTDAAGTEVENTDYLPFGEEILVSSGDPRHGITGYGSSGLLRQKFTGKERDSESGMDYFLARYYSSPMGRFLSVDPGNAGAAPGDPQRWNAYAYATNSPHKFVDPDGREIQVTYHKVPLIGAKSRHTAVRIIPENQEKYSENKSFSNKTEDGKRYAELSAAPSSLVFSVFDDQTRLVSQENKKSDTVVQEGSAIVQVDGDEDEVIDALFKADSNYQDDKPYRLEPDPDDKNTGYNSNSYTSGLLKSVGLTPPTLPANKPAPGYNVPVPTDAFQSTDKERKKEE